MAFFASPAHSLPAAEKRRREILEAALRVIGAGGPDAITHRRVAAEAGVPLGSLTYYFESRKDLVREAFRHYLAEATNALLAIEQDFPATTPERMVELLIEITRREFSEPALVRAEYELILYAARDPDLAREFTAWERGLEVRLGEWFEKLGAGRPLDAARTIIDLVRGFELERFTHVSASEEDLRRRLGLVITALTASRETAASSAAARHIDRGIRKPKMVSNKEHRGRKSRK
jgi:DNA-binding transcriptional regulator YbjK